jgi:hypothetical protein
MAPTILTAEQDSDQQSVSLLVDLSEPKWQEILIAGVVGTAVQVISGNP